MSYKTKEIDPNNIRNGSEKNEIDPNLEKMSFEKSEIDRPGPSRR